MTAPGQSTRERPETQRAKRRMHILHRRADHLARTMGDAKRWETLSPGVQHHIVAEHHALVWALDFMERHITEVMAEARALEVSNALHQLQEIDHAPTL